jgi:flagellar basal-body rod modification protein FlgD
MAITPVSATPSNSAFGLDFKSLLQIILQQLTYQDPLKPMDNFQFVSQLAQFSQLHQSQTLNDSISNLLSTQASFQATGLLGKTVDFMPDGATRLVGVVKSVTFANGQPSLTVATTNGQTVTNVTMSTVVQIQ